jgi:predicted anti-sigma-YlaC factor YlaD
VHTQDHETMRGKLDSYCAGSLDDVEWVRVRTHLAECDTCRTELTQPVLWNRASPRRILPPEAIARVDISPTIRRSHRHLPAWPVLAGTSAVVAVVAFGLGYAVGCLW